MTVYNHSLISLYVHFPFCGRRCRYCDFFSTEDGTASIDGYIDAVANEFRMVIEKNDLHASRIATIYCGGGTPSLLSPRRWYTFVDTVIKKLPFAPDLEWTIECNPDSFTEEKAAVWLDTGVTRLTLGIQSLQDRLLRFLGRPHTARQALDLLENPILTTFNSVGADIMYGLPGQTVKAVAQTAVRVLDSGTAKHLSAYELTIAPDTPFGKHQRLLPLPSEEDRITMHETIREIAERHEFEQYEISNYARPGHRCRHNLRYWMHEPYVGLGASSHSYLHPYRYANIADLRRYILDIKSARFPTAYTERLGTEELSREAILLGLRMPEGIGEDRYRRLTGREFADGDRGKLLEKLAQEGYMVHTGGAWRPTSKGILIADALAGKLA
ncbi:MAG: radical SAM family heme chaperone HemW [Chitinivibrionales bacterium]|nr:radical SAM family heme chaperone HemW [Chitinivibrionales bacterium]MBD3357381.1 radical SAM family heme chaperone HemW [Chitinivibrionales bacterium]